MRGLACPLDTRHGFLPPTFFILLTPRAHRACQVRMLLAVVLERIEVVAEWLDEHRPAFRALNYSEAPTVRVRSTPGSNDFVYKSADADMEERAARCELLGVLEPSSNLPGALLEPCWNLR